MSILLLLTGPYEIAAKANTEIGKDSKLSLAPFPCWVVYVSPPFSLTDGVS